MADNKGATIVIKKIKKGGHGAHGGAWKVAFADFMTAMMAFFLVMWLMGSDEATKASIASYFNNPSAFRGGSDSLERSGNAPSSSYSIFNGMEGEFDEKSVDQPARPRPVYLQEHKVLSKLIDDVFDGNAFSEEATSDYLKFAIPGNIIFQFGSTEISYEGRQYLKKLADIFKNYEGHVQIIGHTEAGETEGDEEKNWELSFKRSMSVRNVLIKDFNVASEQLTPLAKSSKADTSEENHGINVNRRVEFILRHQQQ